MASADFMLQMNVLYIYIKKENKVPELKSAFQYECDPLEKVRMGTIELQDQILLWVVNVLGRHCCWFFPFAAVKVANVLWIL